MFRTKLLDALRQERLARPPRYPQTRVVDVRSVGSGEKALLYLARYLYRGVIQEKDILASEKGQVTFRYRNSKTEQIEYRKLPGEKFLALILQHVLPKGFLRYYIGSIDNSATEFARAVCSHWGIENGLHWVLDVALRENAPENLALLRHIAINAVKQEKTKNLGVKKQTAQSWLG